MRLHCIKGSRQLDWLFSSSHWMWHCFIYFRQSEDIILGYMEMTARSNSNICKTKQRYSTCRNNRSNPAEWGWRRFDEYYISFQSNLPDAIKSSRELINLSCKKSSKGTCNCCKQELQYTELCTCAGQCQVVTKQTYLPLTETCSKLAAKH